jgi:hypothetical protein
MVFEKNIIGLDWALWVLNFGDLDEHVFRKIMEDRR